MRAAGPRLVAKVRASQKRQLEIARIKLRSSPEQVRDFFIAASDVPEITSILDAGAIVREPAQIRHSLLLPHANTSRELMWELSVLRRHAASLAGFIKFESIFVTSLVSGNLTRANDSLRRIEATLGQSQWLLRSQLLLNGIQVDSDTRRGLVQRVSADSNVSPIVHLFLQYHELQTDEATTAAQYRSHLESMLEAQVSGHIDIARYFRFELASPYANDLALDATLLGIGSDGTLIDRLVALRRFLILAYSRGVQVLSPLQARIMVGLAQKTNCQTLLRLSELWGLEPWHAPTPSDIQFQSAISAYTRGEHERAAAQCIDLLKAEPTAFAPYVLLARCLAATGASKPAEVAGFQEHLLLALTHFESMIGDPAKQLAALEKCALRFADTQFGEEIGSYVFHAQHGAGNQGPRFGRDVGLLFGTLAANPLFLGGLNSSSARQWRLMYAPGFDHPGPLELFDLAAGKSNPTAQDISTNVPADRVNRFRARDCIRRGDFDGAIALVEPIVASSNPVASKDARTLLVTSLLQTANARRLVEFVAEECVTRPDFSTSLPLSESVDLGLAARSQVEGTIHWPVLCDIEFRLTRRTDTSPREMSLEDFLDAVNVDRVSDIFQRVDLIEKWPKQLLTHFFEFVSSQDNLAGSARFSSSREVEDERMRTLRALIAWEPKRAELYQDEIRRITTARVTEDAFQVLERTKIRVDVDGLLRELGDSLDSDWEWFKRVRTMQVESLAASFREALLIESEVSLGKEKVKVVFYRDTSQPILRQLILKVRDVFAFSEEYGLDGYLSVGIRHGTLKGKLRASVARHYLILQMMKDHAAYQPSTYWNGRFSALCARPEHLAAFQEVLKDFSTRYDSVIDDLNDRRIQIRVDANGTGLFDLTLDDASLKAIAASLGVESHASDMIDAAIGWLWERTDESLKEVRRYISGDVSSKLNDLLNHFHADVHSLLVDGALRDEVDEAIASARTDLQRALEETQSWFSRSEGGHLPSLEPALPFQAAERQIENIHPGLNFSIQVDNAGVQSFPGAMLRPLSDIAFIAFDNVVKHAGLGDRASATVSISVADSGVRIRIENVVGEDADVGALKKAIANCMASARSGLSSVPYGGVRKEGRSGLVKARKIATVDIKGGKFVAEYTGKSFVMSVVIPMQERDESTVAVH